MDRATQVLRKMVHSGVTPGLQYLHVSADDILFRHQDGLAHVGRHVPVEPETSFSGYSVTKTVTAVAVLQLMERGEISIDQHVSAVLPRFPYPGPITVRHLLSHSAGIPNPMPLRWTHLPSEHALFDRNAFFAAVYAKSPRTKSPPGTRFAYSNLGYQLLGQLIEQLSARSYEEYVTGHVLARLGLAGEALGFALDPARQATGYHSRRSLTFPLLGFLLDRQKALMQREGHWQAFRPCLINGPAYGGLIGNAEGFARFLQALLMRPSPLLSDASMALLFGEQRLVGGAPSKMCMAWFVGGMTGLPFRDHAGGGGGFYAELRIYPSLGRGSVLLCNRTGLRNERLLDKVDPCLL